MRCILCGWKVNRISDFCDPDCLEFYLPGIEEIKDGKIKYARKGKSSKARRFTSFQDAAKPKGSADSRK